MRHDHTHADQIHGDLRTSEQEGYVCPMHPSEMSRSPGICPRCHMALERVPERIEDTSSDVHNHDKHAGHNPAMFRDKFWLSLLLTLPTLVFSPMVQSWFGLELTFIGSHYIPALFGVVIFFYGGLVFLKSARAELAAKRPGMMTLISMAISVAFIYSALVTLNVVSGMDFWWELATLVTIMLLGHWLEMASVESAQGALKELARLLPDEAEVIEHGHSRSVAVRDVKIGDTILVRPGASIPVDGLVIEGNSAVDESMLTGESRPIRKTVGSEAIGGTINGDGALTMSVTRVGSDTAIAGIMKLVEQAQTSKSKTQILADTAAFYLTFIALGAALITWLCWWAVGESTEFILERVVTVLVVACPHALGLAIPLVTAISTTIAAKNGLLIRDRAALESARKVDVVLFDKTGTLTRGEQGVVDVIAKDTTYTLSLAKALEYQSEHTVAKAIVRYADSEGVSALRVENFQALSGRGVEATLEGVHVCIGGPHLLQELGLELDDTLQGVSERASTEGKTVVYVVQDGLIMGAIVLADVIRDESKEAIAQLRALGKRVAMLTGDSEGVADWVSRELGITEHFAEVLPAKKAAVVRYLQKDGSLVAMVGDGINDAPALVQADIGVAIGAGTDVAIESAGIVLASSDPTAVAKIIGLSSRTYRKMLQNLAWAAGYNIFAIPLAAGAALSVGFVLSPAVGAVLMSISTIIVAVNAQLLRKIKL